jgi:hypothetical protein
MASRQPSLTARWRGVRPEEEGAEIKRALLEMGLALTHLSS